MEGCRERWGGGGGGAFARARVTLLASEVRGSYTYVPCIALVFSLPLLPQSVLAGCGDPDHRRRYETSAGSGIVPGIFCWIAPVLAIDIVNLALQVTPRSATSPFVPPSPGKHKATSKCARSRAIGRLQIYRRRKMLPIRRNKGQATLTGP